MMMIEYNDIKDLLIWNDPVLGEISLDFILLQLQNAIKNQKEFEDIIYNILKNSNYNNKDLASLFNLSQTDLFEFYLKMIKNEL